MHGTLRLCMHIDEMHTHAAVRKSERHGCGRDARLCTLQAARDRDPDSKRFRFKPNSVRRGTCCGNIAIRWLALGFILGMLIFATLSVLQVTCLLTCCLEFGRHSHACMFRAREAWNMGA